jgi:hypothetical protein
MTPPKTKRLFPLYRILSEDPRGCHRFSANATTAPMRKLASSVLASPRPSQESLGPFPRPDAVWPGISGSSGGIPLWDHGAAPSGCGEPGCGRGDGSLTHQSCPCQKILKPPQDLRMYGCIPGMSTHFAPLVTRLEAQ